MNIRKNASMTP